MEHSKKGPIALATVTTLAMTLGSGVGAAFAATVTATPVAAMPTSGWTPPSSDPSGITFIPGKGLLVSDAEIEESLAAPINHNNNLFSSTLAGVKTGHGSTVGWSNEPTGVAYVAAPGTAFDGHLFVSDDDRKEIFDIAGAGADGQFGTADDGARTSFKVSAFGNTDPEDVAFDPKRQELWIAGGMSAIVSRVNPGPDNKFTTAADNVVKNFPIPQLDPVKPPSPEGMAWDVERDTVYVLDGESEMVFELAHNGAELNRIDLSAIDMQSPGGITLDPASSGPARTFYIADRGLDPNGTRPASCPAGSPASCEPFNDGVIHKVQVANMPAITNRPPTADAGVDQLIDLGESVTLNGAGVDSDAADTLTFQWTVKGPGTVTMATPNQASTTASGFSAVGDYVFTLTVRDGKGGVGTDTATVRVFTPGAARNVSIPVAIGTDDAQEGGGSTGKFVEVDSADNELGHSGGTAMTKMLTGFRFTGLPVPPGAEIVSAMIQFKVDEAGSGPASFTIAGQASDNATTFVSGGGGDISARPKTTQTVQWSPPDWPAPSTTGGGAAGPGQRTPNLAPILQAIVNRPGWQKGNAAAFMIWGDGRRTAEAKDGLTPPVLLLEFKTAIPNAAPVVNAGPDQTVTLPDKATLAGSASDDGKPTPAKLTTAWSKVSGPGTVTFDNPASPTPKATFSEAGTYVLRLTANDGALSAFDEVTVTVKPAPATPGLTTSVSDRSVMMGAPVEIGGSVSPALTGQEVHLQAWDGGAGEWTDVESTSVTGNTFAFTTTSPTSTAMRYRIHVPESEAMTEATSGAIKVTYYKAKIKRVRHKPDIVVVKNHGAVKLNLGKWTLRNNRNGRVVKLEGMKVKPGKTVRIHTGRGRDDANDMYLGKKKAMWGKHGKAVLRDDHGRLAQKYRY